MRDGADVPREAGALADRRIPRAVGWARRGVARPAAHVGTGAARTGVQRDFRRRSAPTRRHGRRGSRSRPGRRRSRRLAPGSVLHIVVAVAVKDTHVCRSGCPKLPTCATCCYVGRVGTWREETFDARDLPWSLACQKVRLHQNGFSSAICERTHISLG